MTVAEEAGFDFAVISDHYSPWVDASVRMQSMTHPNPAPVWYERLAPLKAVMALYQHLRGSPTGGTSPRVDSGRDYVPGPRAYCGATMDGIELLIQNHHSMRERLAAGQPT